MISMHINRKVNNLLAKFGNDILQDLIVEPMRLTYLKSFHVNITFLGNLAI